MKAMLVVDIPIEMLNDDTCVTITSLNSGMSFNTKLKPMPKKVDVNLKEDEAERIFKKYYWEKDKFGILNFKNAIKYAFVSGYKRCIDEILGEEKCQQDAE